MPWRRPAPLALAVIAVASVLALRFVPYQADDAFIAYRYAAHIVDGLGPVFNPGDAPVEGFSSPAWVGFLVLGGLAFGNEALPAASTVLGVLALWGLAAASVVGAFVAVPGASPHRRLTAAAIAGLVVACNPAAATWAVTGLESDAFALLVLLFALSLGGGLPAQWAVGSAFVAPWLRPEGPWLAVAAVAQQLGRRREFPRWRGDLMRPAVALAVGCATLLIARLSIFGDVLPNTYYAKSAVPGAGASYVADTLTSGWGASIVLAAVCGAVVGRPAHRGYFFAGLAWIAAAWIEGGDWMRYGRFLLPAFGLLALAASGVGTAKAGSVVRWTTRTVVAVAVVVCACTAWRAGNEAQSSERVLRHELQSMAHWIRRTGAASVATIDVGELGFDTDLHVVDLAGLTDRRIAAAPGGDLAKQFDLGYLFEDIRPDLIVLRLSAVPPRDARGTLMADPRLASSEIEARVLADRRIARDYRPVLVQVPAEPRTPYYARMIVRRVDFRVHADAATPGDIVEVSPRAP